MELAFEVLGAGRTPSSQSHPQELIRPSRLHILLIKKVEQQVLVALDQSLRVNLTVLQLFVPISLYALQQSRQGLLLSLAQECFLTFDCLLHFKSNLVIIFLLFNLLALNLQQLCFLVPLHKSKLADFVLHFFEPARFLLL